MLNSTQRNTLLTAIKADSAANQARLAGDTITLLAWCNGSAGSLAWRTNVQPQESDEAANYSSYDTLSAGKRDSWSIFLGFARNFGRNKVRAWVTDVWGNATATSVAESILQAGTEAATRAQVALGGTTKSTGTVSALDRGFTGQVDQDDANWLVNQPA